MRLPFMVRVVIHPIKTIEAVIKAKQIRDKMKRRNSLKDKPRLP